MLSNVDAKNLHHAYLIDAPINDGVTAVESFLAGNLGLKLAGNPDFMKVETERLGIDTARTLRKAQQRKGFAADMKVYLVAFLNITPEAQNALLKSLEEPTDGTHFFIVTPNTGTLLSTLLSRVQKVRIEDAETADTNMESMVTKFLHEEAPERISLVKDIVDDKDAARASDFLNMLEKRIQDHLGQISPEHAEAVLQAQRYISNTGASVKQLLHHLAISLPQLDAQDG